MSKDEDKSVTLSKDEGHDTTRHDVNTQSETLKIELNGVSSANR